MPGWVLAATEQHADVLARGLAVAGLLVAIGSAVLTWQLWRRSGPSIEVRLLGPDGDWWSTVGPIAMIEVANSGRMATLIRAVEFCCRESDGVACQLAVPLEGNFPVELPATGYIRAVPSGADEFEIENAAVIWAAAYRGDGALFMTPRLRLSKLASRRGEPDPGRGDGREDDG